jgi:hypothetical protein
LVVAVKAFDLVGLIDKPERGNSAKRLFIYATQRADSISVMKVIRDCFRDQANERVLFLAYPVEYEQPLLLF